MWYNPFLIKYILSWGDGCVMDVLRKKDRKITEQVEFASISALVPENHLLRAGLFTASVNNFTKKKS